jgi:hypothetical protein
VNPEAGPTYTLETGNDSTGAKCSCCERVTRKISGWVLLDGNAHAAYLAMWTDGHREFGVSMVLSIGGWGGGSVEERSAVALEWKALPSGPSCAVQDAATTRWASDAGVLGRMLSRTEVLNSWLGEEAFRVSDVVFAQDSRFRSFRSSTVQ